MTNKIILRKKMFKKVEEKLVEEFSFARRTSTFTKVKDIGHDTNSMMTNDHLGRVVEVEVDWVEVPGRFSGPDVYFLLGGDGLKPSRVLNLGELGSLTVYSTDVYVASINSSNPINLVLFEKLLDVLSELSKTSIREAKVSCFEATFNVKLASLLGEKISKTLDSLGCSSVILGSKPYLKIYFRKGMGWRFKGKDFGSLIQGLKSFLERKIPMPDISINVFILSKKETLEAIRDLLSKILNQLGKEWL